MTGMPDIKDNKSEHFISDKTMQNKIIPNL